MIASVMAEGIGNLMGCHRAMNTHPKRSSSNSMKECFFNQLARQRLY